MTNATQITPAEINKAASEFEKRIHPAKLRNSEANEKLFVGWVLKNKITNLTVDHLVRFALKDMRNQVEWDVPPKSLRQVDVQAERDTSRPNRARPEDDTWGQGPSVMRDFATKKDHENAIPILGDCRNICATYSTMKQGRMDHGKSERGKAALKAMLAELLKQFPAETLTVKQAESMKEKLKAAREAENF
jgi:hypothetical protein